jgi:branched-chain amino acid transport system permease protein
VGGVANLAYVVMVAAGAYTYAVLTLGPPAASGGFQHYVLGLRLPFPAALAAAGLAGGLIGVLIGVTGLERLRQDYQAMVMLVVSLMAGTVVAADTGLFNGNAGLSLIPNPISGVSGMTSGWPYVGIVAACCLVGFIALRRFTTGPMGRALRALRDDETAAAAIGKDVVRLRLVVQAVGGVLAGLRGALLVAFIGGWSPAAWAPVETLALLTAVIVGGMGSDIGATVGTLVVTILLLQGVQFLPEIRSHPGLKEALGWMVLGAVTIAFVWVRPQGIVPERRPRYEREVSPTHLGRVEPVPPRPEAGAEAILEVERLMRRFGGVAAVDGVSFTVRRGSITGLIGPNGAGKSTALSVISGFLQPSGDSVRFEGTDVTGQPAHELARRGLVRTFQLAREFRGLTTLENLLVAAPCQRGERALGILAGGWYWGEQERELVARARGLLARFEMADKEDELARNLSGGQKRALEVMRALMTQPRLLLLDEPMAGLSPRLAERFEEVLLELRGEGLSVLLVEHELDVVDRLCDHVVVMAQGQVISTGRMAELRTRREVQDAYVLG